MKLITLTVTALATLALALGTVAPAQAATAPLSITKANGNNSSAFNLLDRAIDSGQVKIPNDDYHRMADYVGTSRTKVTTYPLVSVKGKTGYHVYAIVLTNASYAPLKLPTTRFNTLASALPSCKTGVNRLCYVKNSGKISVTPKITLRK